MKRLLVLAASLGVLLAAAPVASADVSTKQVAAAALAHELLLEKNSKSPFQAVSARCFKEAPLHIYRCDFPGIERKTGKSVGCAETYVHYNPAFIHPISFWTQAWQCGKATYPPKPYPGEKDSSQPFLPGDGLRKVSQGSGPPA
jgi:hypothetical protein